MDKQNIKAVSYARVSSKMQEREGFSIPAQIQLIHEYAEKNNIEIVAEFTEAETAKQSGRTKFNEMLNFLKRNPSIKNILVEKTDRLYRNFKDYVLLDEKDFNIHFIKENKILSENSSASVKFEHSIRVVLAKNYIDNLSEETQKGRKRKIEEGYFIGQVPYGYMKTDKITTIPDPQKSLFVKRAFELYAQNNISLRALRKTLYKEGFVYLPSSPMISRAQLENMLKNRCYTGLLKYNGNFYPGKHQPIISNKLFSEVQMAFKKDNKPDTMNKHKFLYKGLIKCGECGKTITCEIVKKKHIYYHCTGSTGACKSKSIYVREEELDKQVNAAIKAVTIDESLADYMNMILKDTYKDLQVMTKEKAEYLSREINTIKTNQEKLLDLLIADRISQEIYDKKLNGYNVQLECLENQLKIEKMNDDKFIDEGQKIIDLSKKLYNLYLKQNIKEKQNMLKTIFAKLWLEEKVLHYEYNKPFNYFVNIANGNKNSLTISDIKSMCA